MSISVTAYNHIPLRMIDGTINLTTDTVRVRLVTSSYTPDPEHTLLADLDANEVSTAQAVDNVAYTEDAVTGDSVTFASLSETFRYIVLTSDDGTTDRLLCYHDLGTDVTVADVDYVPAFAGGVLFDLDRTQA